MSKKANLRRSVHHHKELLQALPKEENSEVCAICLEIITGRKLTELDGCSHKYCHTCIQKWVTEVENSCPQCKTSIKVLTHQDNSEGEQVQQSIGLRRQEDIVGPCFCCNELINLADVIYV